MQQIEERPAAGDDGDRPDGDREEASLLGGFVLFMLILFGIFLGLAVAGGGL